MNSSIAFGRATFLAVLVASACACGPRNFPFEGEWRGKQKVDAVPDANPLVVAQLSEIKLIVQPHDRFSLLIGGRAIGGSISVSGNDATLTVTEIQQQPIDRDPAFKDQPKPEFQLKAQPDKTILFIDPKATDKEGIPLNRIATGQENRP